MSRTFTKLTLCLCAVVLLGAPSVSHGGLFDWWHGGCNSCYNPCGGVTTLRYRPLFSRFGLFGARRAAYYNAGYFGNYNARYFGNYNVGYVGNGYNACCRPCPTTCCRSVQYVPQTCYRPTVCNVPVTTCQRVCACDPCTGCPVTVMRPVTTYVRRVRYTPVTTYRAVCMPTTCCSPCYDPCCNPCCNPCPCPCPGTAVPSTVPFNGGVPSTVPFNGGVPSTVPLNGGVINGGPIDGGTIDGGNVGPTYKEGSSSSIRPNGQNGSTNSGNYNTNYRGGAPLRPAQQDRTTSAPRSWTFTRVSARQDQDGEAKAAEAPHGTAGQPLDDGGWQSVQR